MEEEDEGGGWWRHRAQSATKPGTREDVRQNLSVFYGLTECKDRGEGNLAPFLLRTRGDVIDSVLDKNGVLDAPK